MAQAKKSQQGTSRKKAGSERKVAPKKAGSSTKKPVKASGQSSKPAGKSSAGTGKTPAPKRARPAKKAASTRSDAAAAGGILAWEDDPMSGSSPINRPVPNLSATPLALTIRVNKVPAAKIYPLGSNEFRYWAAAEAARRGADFWGAILPARTNWHPGGALEIRLDQGVDLNAYYDRTGLSFFHDTVGGQTVYSGESPDIVCHELGHAVLDAIRPELWNTGFDEVASFHESFGDMSALLSALQLPSIRKAILSDTGGRLYRSSRLSRLAEQLGWAVRQVRSDAADPDCLRNAVNTFFYQDPVPLPPSGPATVLSSEPHSFSRVFTGAFFEGLAGMLAVQASSNPTVDDLEQVSQEAARLLVAAIQAASVVPDYYSQVAAAMVNADANAPFTGTYRDVLKGAFVRHGILSLEAASGIAAPRSLVDPSSPQVGMGVARSIAPPAPQRLTLLGTKYGLGATTLLVHAPDTPRQFSATAAAVGSGPAAPQTREKAADGFVTDLFRRGRVELGDYGNRAERVTHPLAKKTHQLIVEGDGFELVRLSFDCGFGDSCKG